MEGVVGTSAAAIMRLVDAAIATEDDQAVRFADQRNGPAGSGFDIPVRDTKGAPCMLWKRQIASQQARVVRLGKALILARRRNKENEAAMHSGTSSAWETSATASR